MADYIDRTKLIKAFLSNGSLFTYGTKTVAAIISRINMQPAADVVEVVRCKDCKYYEKPTEWDELGVCKCGYIAVSYNGEIYPSINDFCSHGERKEKGK